VTPEGKIEAYLKRRVEQTHGQIRKLAWLGRRGAPDRMVWWKGPWGPLLAFVEVKAGLDRFSKVQDQEIQRMRNYGVPVYIARSNEEIDEIVEKVRKGIAT